MSTLPVPTFTEAEFHKASRSEPNGSCVQIARRDGWVAVRDDKTRFDTDGDHRLLLPANEFDRALTAWRSGSDGPVKIIRQDHGGSVMRLADGSGPDLTFSSEEVDAFLDGVAHREFDAYA